MLKEGSRTFISQKSKVAQLGCQVLLREPSANPTLFPTYGPRVRTGLTRTFIRRVAKGSIVRVHTRSCIGLSAFFRARRVSEGAVPSLTRRALRRNEPSAITGMHPHRRDFGHKCHSWHIRPIAPEMPDQFD